MLINLLLNFRKKINVFLHSFIVDIEESVYIYSNIATIATNNHYLSCDILELSTNNCEIRICKNFINIF